MTRFTDSTGLEVYMMGGQEVTAEEYHRALGTDLLDGEVVGTLHPKGWPMASEAMEVHPSQVELAKKLDKKRGAPPTEYNRLGQPIFTSERHKRAFIKVHGCHDNNAYF